MINQGGKIIIILFFVLTGFFCVGVRGWAQSAVSVLISEVAWMGTELSANDEWIELYNAASHEFSLVGWTLAARDGTPLIELTGSIGARDYYLLERSDDESAPGVTADQIYSGALGNTGEHLELIDDSGVIVFSLAAGEAWPAGDNQTKQTMALTTDGEWRHSRLPGGTPGAPNDWVEGQEADSAEDDDASETSEEVLVETLAADRVVPDIRVGEVLINEFVSDPADGEAEWVELFNAAGRALDLEGCWLEDGSQARTTLAGSLAASGSGRFRVILKPKGNLNNSGDKIAIFNAAGHILDSVIYGDWGEGLASDHAPVAQDPWSTARVRDGQRNGRDSDDFVLTTTPTPGASNQINAPVAPAETVELDLQSGEGPEISEIFPNPFGRDEEAEFIELYNPAELEMDLCAWEIGDQSQARFKFLSERVSGCRLPSHAYLVLYRSETKIALDNNGDTVYLYAPGRKKPLRSLAYARAVEGASYGVKNISARPRDYVYAWSQVISPGTRNVYPESFDLEVDFSYSDYLALGVPVFFDSSDLVLAPDREYVFVWDFGDGFTNTLACPEHTFFQAGDYTVSLRVGDGHGTGTMEKLLRIGRVESVAPSSVSVAPLPSGRAKLQISELLPNPIGLDGEGEFIEIFNQGDTRVNLLNWSLADGSASAKPYTWSSDYWLEADEYYRLDRRESKLALNNDFDVVRLYSDKKELVDEVEYEGPNEGYAYARGENGKWFWTSEATPGAPNVIKVSNAAYLDTDSDWSGPSEVGQATEAVSATCRSIRLDELAEVALAEQVCATGTVTVAPGVLGAQIFYMQADGGIQIYSYKKDFPVLAEGDQILVRGILAASGGEYRLKTKTSEDITVLEGKERLLARQINCDRVDDSLVGALIEVAGVVVDRQGANVFLDDGSDELKLYIKTTTGIEASSLQEGEEIRVTGILSKTNTGRRLLPRSDYDIVRLNSGDPSTETKVLGEVVVNDEWTLPVRNRPGEFLKYALVAASGLVVVLAWFLYKK